MGFDCSSRTNLRDDHGKSRCRACRHWWWFHGSVRGIAFSATRQRHAFAGGREHWTRSVRATNGQVIPTLKKESPDALLQRYGVAQGNRVANLLSRSAETLFELVSEYEIACEANQGGWVQPAVSKRQLDRILRCADAWARQGANVEILNRSQTASALGSDFYLGSWRATEGGSVQPLALARGLADAALAEGVRIFENSAATSIEGAGSGWRVRVGRYCISARQVLMGAAADTAALAEPLSKQIVPAYFYQLATRPLANGKLLLPGCGATSDAQGDLYFFRKDVQERLITGGTFILTRDWQQRLRAQVQKRLDHVFPEIGDWEIETQWSGYVAMTADFYPRFAKLGNNFYGWIGCNGRGVALSISMGKQLAHLAAGRSIHELAFPLETHGAFPFRSLAPVGVAATLTAMRLRDRLQRWDAHDGNRNSANDAN